MKIRLVTVLIVLWNSPLIYSDGVPANSHRICPKYDFQCDNGNCIDELRKCDDRDDCGDMSDEKECGSAHCNSDTHFKCSDGVCIDKSLVCDSAKDCSNDEDNCFETCPKDKVLCDRGHCISSKYVCDGVEDCTDGSDEQKCDKMVCPAGYAFCDTTSECIRAEFFCDGTVDCEGGTDETKCENMTRCFPESGHFPCHDHSKCLKKELVCDGTTHCVDHSDEQGQCKVKCLHDQCEHGCYQTPNGPQCLCKKGFRMEKNSTKCLDVDECMEDVQVCDHFCRNSIGSFNCSCAENYQLLHDDKASCRTRTPALLIFSVGYSIKAKYIRKQEVWLVYEGDMEISAVAYDQKDENVYWVSDSREIRFKGLRGSGAAKTFIHQGLQQPEGIAIDWITRNLYVSDVKMNHILVCSLHAGNCLPIVKNAGQPRALQIDYSNGYLYWTAVQFKTIRRSYLDGSEIKTVISSNSVWPNCLAIDYPTSRLYWLDTHEDHVDSCDSDGKDCKHLHNADASHAHNLLVWQDRLYWTSWHQHRHQEIHSCRKRDGEMWRSEYKDERPVRSMTIYSLSIIANKHSPCPTTNGKTCSHLCLSSPKNGYICACPEEMKLDANGHDCHEKSVVESIVSLRSRLYKVPLRNYGNVNPLPVRFPQIEFGSVGDMTFVPQTDDLYFADPKNDFVASINIKTHSIRIHLSNVKHPMSLAVDWLRGNLYWINGYHHSVDVVKIGGHLRDSLYSRVFRNPLGLAIDVEGGFLYVSDGGMFTTISRCSLNGSICHVVVKDDLAKPTSLSLDVFANPKVIYWTDSKKNVIEKIDVNGENRNVVVSHLREPLKIHVTRNDIFWTEKNKLFLNVISKAGGKAKKYYIDVESNPNEDWVLAVTTLGDKIEQTVKNPCSVHPRCTQFCYTKLFGDSNDCGCVQGYELKDDGYNCIPKQCKDGYRKCDNQECILQLIWCDGSEDCDDGSDENNCSIFQNCSKDEFRCDSGVCVSMDDKCDGMTDCDDKSDESENLCRDVKTKANYCPREDEWRCSTGECIPTYFRCNKKQNCADGSDELHCPKEVACSDQDRKCRNGQCVPILWWCDGQNDCPMGEDELNCPCKLGQYQCKSGRCLEEWKLCRGLASCGSNEKLNITCPRKQSTEYSTETCSAPGYISCGSWSKNGTRSDVSGIVDSEGAPCVPSNAWCNGTVECWNKADESSCKVNCVNQNLVRCKTGDRCIEESYRCDNYVDCPDGSDEENCHPPLPSSDLSDHLQKSKCSKTEFECPAEKCIPLSKVCDGIQNCLDGADESAECDKCKTNNGGCHHICHNDPIKVRCSCRKGYMLWGDLRSCRNENECQNDELCHHSCVDTKGSFYCNCQEGYTLLPDGITCKPNNGHHWTLAAVQGGNIHLLESTLDDVSMPTQAPSGIDVTNSHFIYDPTNASILCIENNKSRLHRRSTGGQWSSVYLGTNKISATSLDYINRNLYLATLFNIYPKLSNIEKKFVATEVKVFNLNNKRLATVFAVQGKIITAMEISVALREIVTCESERSNEGHPKVTLVLQQMDGSIRKTLASKKIRNCDFVTLDEIKQRVYWMDTVLNSISSVDFLGYDRRIFNTEDLHGGHGLALMNHNLVWFNKQYRSLTMCSIRNPKDCKSRTFENVVSIVNIEPVYDLTIETPCKDPTTCEYICTPYTAGVHHCLCKDGYATNEENKCVKSEMHDEILPLEGHCEDKLCKHGTCEEIDTTHFYCRCDSGFRGTYCDVSKKGGAEGDQERGPLVGVILFLVFVVFIFGAFVFCYKKRPHTFWKKSEMRESDLGESTPDQKQENREKILLDKQSSQQSNDSAIGIESPIGAEGTNIDVPNNMILLSPDSTDVPQHRFKTRLDFSPFH